MMFRNWFRSVPKPIYKIGYALLVIIGLIGWITHPSMYEHVILIVIGLIIFLRIGTVIDDKTAPDFDAEIEGLEEYHEYSGIEVKPRETVITNTRQWGNSFWLGVGLVGLISLYLLILSRY